MRFLSVLLLLGIAALASAVDTIPKVFGEVRTRAGAAQSGARVLITLTGTGTNATLYADDETTVKVNPLTTDSNGVYGFKVTPGVYDITVSLNGTVIDQRAHYQVASPTASVSSIALTMPAEYSVAGSPVTTSGTFVVTKATEAANTFWAGPTTGAAATPAFRAVVPADLTAALLIPPAIGTTTPAAGKFTSLIGTSVTDSGLTSGRIPYASTGGLLADAAGLTFNGTTLVVPNITNSSLTAGRVPFAGTAGLMQDASTLTYAAVTGLVADQLTSSGLTSGRITTAGTAGKLQDFAGLCIVGTPSSTAPSTGTNGPGLLSGLVIQKDGNTGLTLASFNNGGSGASAPIIGYACEGLPSAPAATVASDNTQFGLRGHDGTDYTATQATVQLLANGTWTPTSRESVIRFRTTPSGGTTIATAGQIDGNQCLVMGGTFTSVATFSAGTLRPHIQTASTGTSNAGIVQSIWNASATGATSILAKSRSGTVGTQGVITTGDTLGTLSWQGDDGTNFIQAASIVAQAEGTVGTGQIPGRLRMLTATSAGASTQAIAIDSNQTIMLGLSTITSSALFTSGTVNPRLQILGTTIGGVSQATVSYSASNVGPSIYLGKTRSSTIGTMTVVNASDALGTIDFQGADGTNFVSGAQIVATATGTPASTRMGSSMLFKTATDAAPSVMTTAVTIDNTQNVTFTANTDNTFTTGYGKMGLATSGTSTVFYLAQTSCYNSTDFAIQQASNGQTIVNAKSGQAVGIRIGNSSRFSLSSAAASYVSGIIFTYNDTTNPTSISTGSVINLGGEAVTKNLIVGFGVHQGVTSTATAAGTTTLTATSVGTQIFTGSTTQTLQLPAANLFGAGISVHYTVMNRSSGTVTASRAGSDTINAAATTFACATVTATEFWSDGVSAWYTK